MLKKLLVLGGAVFSCVAGCGTPTCVFANSNLRFGNGAQNSVNSQGLFEQPFYYSHIANAWYKLTFANFPLDTAIGTGNMTATHWSLSAVADLYSLTPSNVYTDYSGFVTTSTDGSTTSTGYGSIVSYRTFRINNQNIRISNIFSLGQNANFVRTVTHVTNVDVNNVNNVMVWIGTRDDFVGNTDINTKTRGNLIGGNFTAIQSSTDPSKAIMITNPTEGILFYSETPGVSTVYAFCCSFANVYNLNPTTVAPFTPDPTDGSYAIVLPIGLLRPNESASIVWYYAAGAISSLNSVVESVAISQVLESSAAETPTNTPTETVTPTNTRTETGTGTKTRTPTKSSTGTSSETGTETSTQTQTETSTETSTETATETSTGTSTETSTGTETSSETSSGTGTSSNTATPTKTPTRTKTVTPTRSSNATITMEIFPTIIRSKTPFFTFTPVSVVEEDKTKAYSTAGIALGALGIAGGIVIAVMVVLNIARNIKKPDNERRPSIESSSQISRQSSTRTHESEISRRPSVRTEESEISRTSSIRRSESAGSDSDSSGSKEVIDMAVSSALSPAPRRNDKGEDFSLIKVSKDELNEVMSILRQRNKAVSVYK